MILPALFNGIAGFCSAACCGLSYGSGVTIYFGIASNGFTSTIFLISPTTGTPGCKLLVYLVLEISAVFYTFVICSVFDDASQTVKITSGFSGVVKALILALFDWGVSKEEVFALSCFSSFFVALSISLRYWSASRSYSLRSFSLFFSSSFTLFSSSLAFLSISLATSLSRLSSSF